SHTWERKITFSITIWRTRPLDTCECSTRWPLTSHGLFITRREQHMPLTMLLRNGLRNIKDSSIRDGTRFVRKPLPGRRSLASYLLTRTYPSALISFRPGTL